MVKDTHRHPQLLISNLYIHQNKSFVFYRLCHSGWGQYALEKNKSQWLKATKVHFWLMQSPLRIWVTLRVGDLGGGSAECLPRDPRFPRYEAGKERDRDATRTIKCSHAKVAPAATVGIYWLKQVTWPHLMARGRSTALHSWTTVSAPHWLLFPVDLKKKKSHLFLLWNVRSVSSELWSGSIWNADYESFQHADHKARGKIFQNLFFPTELNLHLKA